MFVGAGEISLSFFLFFSLSPSSFFVVLELWGVFEPLPWATVNKVAMATLGEEAKTYHVIEGKPTPAL